MHILIVEDEEFTRSELCHLLKILEAESTCWEAENGQQALAMVDEHPIEVVFLDIDMPGLDGLAVASLLMQREESPLIVFATAYDQHAVQAFELRALDYILKPYRPQRLAETLARARVALQERDVLVKKEAVLREYLHDAVPATVLTKLWGERENGTGVLIDFKEIMWIEVNDKKVCAHTVDGEKASVRLKMQELEERLSAHNFARVHRSYIINLDHVANIHPWFSGTYLIDMRDADKTQIPMSRNFGRQLKQLTGWMR